MSTNFEKHAKNPSGFLVHHLGVRIALLTPHIFMYHYPINANGLGEWFFPVNKLMFFRKKDISETCKEE